MEKNRNATNGSRIRFDESKKFEIHKIVTERTRVHSIFR